MSLNIYLGTNLGTKQTQINSQRLQQLAILHMTIQEVAELANEQLQSNPMLDVQETNHDDIFSHISLNALSKKGEDEHSYEPENSDSSETISKLHGENFHARKSDDNPTSDSFLDYYSRPESLTDYLSKQLVNFPLTDEQNRACRYLIESLDERGFFVDSLEWIAETYNMDIFELTQMLYVIQSLDPPGIGARNLEECLILQLAESNQFNSYTVRIVKEMLPLLSKNKISDIAKLLGISLKEAELNCQAVRDLSPIPARGFYTGNENMYIIPDAIVQPKGKDFVIQMNDSIVPHLIIHEEYMKMLSSSDDAELRTYLKEHWTAAKNLITDIDARKKTLYALICEIVKKQPEFFLNGKNLRPMVMSDIADALEMHVSTISRAIKGKYIVCAAGTVSLRSLFTVGYGTQETNAVSATVIKHKLVELIMAENPATPMSDEVLRKAFANIGIEISRRTVAKYREEQGIPAAKFRKKNWT